MIWGHARMTRRRPTLRYLAALGISAAALFCALAAYLRSLETAALSSPAITEQLTASGKARPLAAVSQALREMKLVTVAIDTTVTATTGHDSWRGDVQATIRAPVRLLYGADLSRIDAGAMAYSPLSRGYHIRIPAPERIATEVCGDSEDAEVQIGWLRFRSVAGEYYLGQARKNLYERARDLTLSPADAAFVRRATREQTEALVRKIVGPDAPVTIAFQDGAP